jgi:uncharacterized OB-fold protein
VSLGVCDTCGAGFFPSRLLCPECGGARFTDSPIRSGVVEESTTVHRSVGGGSEPTALATVRLPGGQRIIAGLTKPVAPGTAVELVQRGGAVFVRTGKP